MNIEKLKSYRTRLSEIEPELRVVTLIVGVDEDSEKNIFRKYNVLEEGYTFSSQEENQQDYSQILKVRWKGEDEGQIHELQLSIVTIVDFLTNDKVNHLTLDPPII